MSTPISSTPAWAVQLKEYVSSALEPDDAQLKDRKEGLLTEEKSVQDSRYLDIDAAKGLERTLNKILLDAFFKNDLKKAEACVREGATAVVSWKSSGEGMTLLMYAAKSGDVDKVNFCLRHDADTSDVNNSGETALSLCAYNTYAKQSHQAVLNILIERVGSWSGLFISKNGYPDITRAVRNPILVPHLIKWLIKEFDFMNNYLTQAGDFADPNTRDRQRINDTLDDIYTLAVTRPMEEQAPLMRVYQPTFHHPEGQRWVWALLDGAIPAGRLADLGFLTQNDLIREEPDHERVIQWFSSMCQGRTWSGLIFLQTNPGWMNLFREYIKSNPAQLQRFTSIYNEKDWDALSHIIVVDQWRSDRGGTVLHLMLAQHASKTRFSWMVKRYPQLWSVPDHQGQTAADLVRIKTGWGADFVIQYEKSELKRSVKELAVRPSRSTKKPRL